MSNYYRNPRGHSGGSGYGNNMRPMNNSRMLRPPNNPYSHQNYARPYGGGGNNNNMMQPSRYYGKTPVRPAQDANVLADSQRGHYDYNKGAPDGGNVAAKHRRPDPPREQHVPEKRAKAQPKGAYCKACNQFIEGDYNEHCRSPDHLRVVNQGRKVIPTPALSDLPKSFASPIQNETSMSSLNEAKRPEDIVIPEYNEKETYASDENTIIKVSGYFCILCHKFYLRESSVYDDHCRSREHYDQYVSLLRDKRNALRNRHTKSGPESEQREEFFAASPTMSPPSTTTASFAANNPSASRTDDNNQQPVFHHPMRKFRR